MTFAPDNPYGYNPAAPPRFTRTNAAGYAVDAPPREPQLVRMWGYCPTAKRMVVEWEAWI